MKKLKVGLQLFGIREAMAEDMDAALKMVKEIGYDYVEFAGYYGKTAEEINFLLKKHELEAVSVHQGLDWFINEGQVAIDFLKTIGVKYSAIPWYAVDEFFNNWDSTMEKFTQIGELLKKNDIQLMYHNHDFEFKKIDGVAIIDKMYSTIPNDILQAEFDTCWIHYAGNEPASYLRKYSGRTNIVHLKDFVCEKLGGGPVYELIGNEASKEKTATKEENGFKFRPVGYGIQDWKTIISACEEIGAEYVVVEQDNWYDDDPFECARMSRKYLKDNFDI